MALGAQAQVQHTEDLREALGAVLGSAKRIFKRRWLHSVIKVETRMSAGRKTSIVVVAITMALVIAETAFGQAPAFPSKPIRMIIPYPAGGSADAQLRPVTEAMRPVLGQPIIIEAHPGAGGVISARYLIEQKGDGYTVGLVSNGSAIRSALQNPPFDIRKDLAPIALMVETPIAIAVNTSKLAVKSLEQVVAYAKTNPGKLNFSSFGEGTMAHLDIEYIGQASNVKLTHVPYNGSSAEMTALLRGDSDLGVNSLAVYRGGVAAGKLKIIAVTSGERSEAAPDIPGMRESGFSGFDIPGWSGFSAPANTPTEILVRLNTAVNQALRDPLVKDQYAKLGVIATGGSRERMMQQINKEIAVYEKVIKTAQIVIE